ncbi:hypothetical protein CEXT_15291 [Caerostris extrusa]|uniref:Uncharacterized protein n=1 Tax=Caerostris extrusa TaxID=172846 RepID=A0AAV4NAR5_CAEEX|nr:hypothetical protein CEXT_15291 [Caerostris extrusa]
MLIEKGIVRSHIYPLKESCSVTVPSTELEENQQPLSAPQRNREKKSDRGISTSKHIDFEDSGVTLEVPNTSPKTQRRVVD